MACLDCFLVLKWHRSQWAGPSSINPLLKKMPHRSVMGQSNGGIFSTDLPPSQMTLPAVNLTNKTKQNKKLNSATSYGSVFFAYRFLVRAFRNESFSSQPRADVLPTLKPLALGHRPKVWDSCLSSATKANQTFCIPSACC